MAELHSKIHARVAYSDDLDQTFDLALPIAIGDGPGQCPRYVADILITLATEPDEFYEVSTDRARPSDDSPAATPLTASAEHADPKASAPRRKAKGHGA
jgi:hypothetical protein